MKKIIPARVIDYCAECPHHEIYDNQHLCLYRWTQGKDYVINSIGIPEWCPLESVVD